MEIVVYGLLAASVAGNVVLAILYGRAVKGATQRDQALAQVKDLTEKLGAATLRIAEKETKLRAAQKLLVSRLTANELAGLLSEHFNSVGPNGTKADPKPSK